MTDPVPLSTTSGSGRAILTTLPSTLGGGEGQAALPQPRRVREILSCQSDFDATLVNFGTFDPKREFLCGHWRGSS
jgi:hypothetical protein